MENLHSTVKEITKNLGITDYRIDFLGNSNVGDGYMGEMIFFKILYENGKCLDLLLKKASKNENFRKFTLLDMNFKRELLMYTEIFPTLKENFSENSEILNFIPKLFWYSYENLNESLIMENLKEQKFQMWPKNVSLNLINVKLIMKKFAEFHGTFMVFKKKNPEKYEEWKPKLFDIRYDLLKQLGLIKHNEKNFKKILNLLKELGENELCKKYEKIEKKLNKFYKPPEDVNDRIVITHDDLWINNIMFKLEENSIDKEAKEIKFLDFQVSCLNTPISDLSFFIYGIFNEEISKNFHEIIDHYYFNLEKFVNYHGLTDLPKTFNYDNYIRHWKNYGMNGVLSSIELFKLQLYEDYEIPNIQKLCEENKIDELNSGNHFDFPFKKEKLYYEKLIKVFKHYGTEFL